ncbi:MAG: R3H domain protein [Firmicutes bacterium ADurb.Bin193]|nr:MAG: R3H domain protein [Firmicutes bacterium ADurb.Bin193]
MKSVKVSAKTVEEAVRSALIRLGVSEEEAVIEIMDEGSKGLFGIGGKEARVLVSVKEKEETSLEKAKEFIDGIIKNMKLDCTFQASEDDESVKIIVSGKGVGGIIGRRGETLDAVQYLTSLYVNKGKHGEGYKRVIIDSENYRAKREETLIRLAKSMADKAVRYRRDMIFEPMNPYERRIIHSALQEYGSVTTRSIGEEPNRKIIVSPK